MDDIVLRVKKPAKKLPLQVMIRIGNTFQTKKYKLKYSLEDYRAHVDKYSEYIRSKNECRFTYNLTMDETDDANPKNSFHKESSRLKNTEEDLERVRQLVEQSRYSINQQWEDLYKKEKTLQESFIKFNSFIGLNFVKRERAEMKLNEQRILKDRRIELVQQLMDRMNNLKLYKEKVDVLVKTHEIYEQFLSEVLYSYTKFTSIDQVTTRYDVLLETKNALATKQQDLLTTLENNKYKLLVMAEEFFLIVLGMNIKIRNLHDRFNNAHGTSDYWEQELSNIKFHIIAKQQEISSTKAAIWDLYLKMCVRKQISPTILKEDLSEQCVFIKNTLKDISRVMDILRVKSVRKLKKAVSTRVA